MFRSLKTYMNFESTIDILKVGNLPLTKECLIYFQRFDCNLIDYECFLIKMTKRYVKSCTTKSFEDFVKDLYRDVDLTMNGEDML